MAEYWIADSQGRVLGPVGLQVLSDLLLAGRVTEVTRVSRDGERWLPLESVPELAWLKAQRGTTDRHHREREEAKKLLSYLESYRGRPAHEIFRVAEHAPTEVYREAFFRLSKKFHPDAVPADAAPELRDACAMAFRLFSTLMNRVETSRAVRPPAASARPQAAPQARAAPPPPPAPPKYDAEQFVGIKKLPDGKAQAEIRVTSQNIGMFTDHPLVNFRSGGFFLAESLMLPLGTVVAVTLNFDGNPPHTIVTRGRVAWEDARKDAQAKGFGVTLELRQGEKDFIRDFIKKVQSTASPTARPVSLGR